MPRDNSKKIVLKRFLELKTLQGLDAPFNGDLYFRNDDLTIVRRPDGEPLRKDRQRDIAYMFGVSEITLSRNVRGQQSPSKKTLELFMRYYGINQDWLTGDSDVKTLGGLVKNVIDRAQELDSILQELLAVSGIKCQYENPTNTIGGIGYNVNGRYLTADEFHALAVKVSDFLKFEIDHWK